MVRSATDLAFLRDTGNPNLSRLMNKPLTHAIVQRRGFGTAERLAHQSLHPRAERKVLALDVLHVMLARAVDFRSNVPLVGSHPKLGNKRQCRLEKIDLRPSYRVSIAHRRGACAGLSHEPFSRDTHPCERDQELGKGQKQILEPVAGPSLEMADESEQAQSRCWCCHSVARNGTLKAEARRMSSMYP
jgi:hypothetical protein